MTKKRFQVTFTPSAVNELEELKHYLGLSSVSDVLRRATKVLQLVVRAQLDGKDVVLVKPGAHPEKIVLL